MEDALRYIITWLLRGNEEAAAQVGYTANPEEAGRYRLVITPNGHWGKDWVMPDMAQPRLEGNRIPVDILYNTAFFISRAEELLTTKRDRHGRFTAACSLLQEGDRLQHPLLDEYSRFLIEALAQTYENEGLPSPIALPEEGFSHIYLTHDIDSIDQYRHLRGALGGIARGKWAKVRAAWRDMQADPAYTFPFFWEQDRRMSSPNEPCSVIYFVKHTSGKGFDYPQYRLSGRDYRRVEHLLLGQGAQLGVHGSYYGLQTPSPYPFHRAHYLRCDIAQMRRLCSLGVTDDFTMGFPDRAGFRLQTCRAVRWLDPATWCLTPLTLHPLTIMDCSLYGEDYMHLTEEEALRYSRSLIRAVRHHRGELVLLWHNTNPSASAIHFPLYSRIIDLLTE